MVVAVRYMNDDPSHRSSKTANEIHIPVGRVIMIRGMSNDVIHSFWIPNFVMGKRDLIPSRVTTEWIEADHTRVCYRGQCAEFCGLQHAHMAFWVIAEPENTVRCLDEDGNCKRRARNQQIRLSTRPANSSWTMSACYCHPFEARTAAGRVAPDLTHFGTRRTIAAGTLPNTIRQLERMDPGPADVMKPGNRMATIALNRTILNR